MRELKKIISLGKSRTSAVVRDKSVKSGAGFTVIELVIVIAITVMITLISVANFRRGEKQKRAAIASDTITNALRNAQNFTLTGKKTNNSNANCQTPINYYLSFTTANPGQFSLYAVNDNEPGNCSNPDLIETYYLPSNTRIQAGGLKVIKVDGSSAVANSSLNIYFTLPLADLTYNVDSGVIGGFTIATVALETTDGTVSKTVRVDGVSGRIGE